MSDITWRKEFNDRTLPVTQALARIPDGATVFIEPGAGEPRYLVDHLASLIEEKGLKILYGWSLREAPHINPAYEPRPSYFYLTKMQHEQHRAGLVDSIPINISEIPLLMQKGIIKVDVALIQTGGVDAHGQLSLGIAVDITLAALENASLVIAQVNRFMPRTHGASFIDFKKIDLFVKKSEELAEVHAGSIDSDVERQLGKHISHLIPDGSTIQIGQGRVPPASVRECFNKKDIGIHSMMISDWAMDLIQAGTVNNQTKPIHRGKVVTSFAMGTRRLYEFMDDSPLFEMHGADYLNDPDIIMRHDRFISINGAHKVDLTGQVFNRERPIEFYSHMGGIGEISRNAIHSRGGRNILVLSSRDKNGQSNIIPVFENGEGLLLGRADVDYIVTEYGYARLRGLSLRERTLKLIELAHPSYREDLLAYAIEKHSIDRDLPLASVVRKNKQPWHYTKVNDARSLLIREASLGDFDAIRGLFFSLSSSERTMRFFKKGANISSYILTSLGQPGYRILLAFLQGIDGEHPVGLVEYQSDDQGKADLALAVSPEYRRLHIGSLLMERVLSLATSSGVIRITAEVLRKNSNMLRLMGSLPSRWEKRETGESVLFEHTLDAPAP